VGDGHICIPLCLGVFALIRPLPLSGFDEKALWLLLGTAGAHGGLLLACGGLPRWAGAALVGAYGWFVYAGLLG
jgi:cation:H+ antiporter